MVGVEPVRAAEMINLSCIEAIEIDLRSLPNRARHALTRIFALDYPTFRARRGAWVVAHSSSGPGHLPLKEEIRGSNPLCATS